MLVPSLIPVDTIMVLDTERTLRDRENWTGSTLSLVSPSRIHLEIERPMVNFAVVIPQLRGRGEGFSICTVNNSETTAELFEKEAIPNISKFEQTGEQMVGHFFYHNYHGYSQRCFRGSCGRHDRKTTIVLELFPFLFSSYLDVPETKGNSNTSTLVGKSPVIVIKWNTLAYSSSDDALEQTICPNLSGSLESTDQCKQIAISNKTSCGSDYTAVPSIYFSCASNASCRGLKAVNDVAIEEGVFNSCVRRQIPVNTSKSQVINHQGSTSINEDTHTYVAVSSAPVHVPKRMMSPSLPCQSQTIDYCEPGDAVLPLENRGNEQTPVFAVNCETGSACETAGLQGWRTFNIRRNVSATLNTLFTTLLPLFALLLGGNEFNGEKSALRKSRNRSGMNKRPTRYCGFANLQKQLRRRLIMTSIMMLLLLFTLTPAEAAVDLRDRIINGTEPCFRYVPESNLFHVNCSILHWKAQGYESDTYISLSANEIFDGGGNYTEGLNLHGQYGNGIGNAIDLEGIEQFDGLFRIKAEVSTIAEAPLLRNVHVRNGELSSGGGFIVQQKQRYFMIDSCSSSGNIGSSGGGICGQQCGQEKGEIQIFNSFSSGKIMGLNAGGIGGRGIGYRRGTVHITQCYSTGVIEATSAGGICGDVVGRDSGQVFIKQSYSTGDIVSKGSGGIVGNQAGFEGGYLGVHECYTTGQISAEESGGITGSAAADYGGKVNITDCYTRGAIDGDKAGGITGAKTGGCCDPVQYGDVYINRAYASGIVKHTGAGGFIGRIDSGFSGHTVHVQYSVYNSGTGKGKMTGGHPSNSIEETGISDDLDDIRGQLYHINGSQQWDNDRWALNGSGSLPILRFQLLPNPSPSPTMSASPSPVEATKDLRDSIISGNEPCFHYTFEKSLFHMNCSTLYWKAEGYSPDTYISLGANETFDGDANYTWGLEAYGPDDNGINSIIDLSGIEEFDGLFRIKENVSAIAEAPLIRNVDVRNGELSSGGGFIVQQKQRYFMIDSCSSSGNIGSSGGGICGQQCGQEKGEIKISHSFSTGKIMGKNAGGITGQAVGHDGGMVNITQCYSAGDIGGMRAGGICGDNAGSESGRVYIRQCCSSGNILSGASSSGGIVGQQAGLKEGYVHIQESYSTGEISADYSGGIAGDFAVHFGGELHILDCYSRGDIDGQYAGGIAGKFTGGCCGPASYGDVHIRNTYASGIRKHSDAGGIIGSIDADFNGHTVHVQHSVYNAKLGNTVGYDRSGNLRKTGNSNDLDDIRGQLYHYQGIQQWSNDTWVVRGAHRLPVLRFQPLDSLLTAGSSSSKTTVQVTSGNRRVNIPVKRIPCKQRR